MKSTGQLTCDSAIYYLSLSLRSEVRGEERKEKEMRMKLNGKERELEVSQWKNGSRCVSVCGEREVTVLLE